MTNKTYYLYAENESVKSLTTDSLGLFSLKNNQTATFLVDISETTKTYYVKEGEISNFKDPEYSYQSSIDGIEEVNEQNSFIGMKVSASGSVTAADSVLLSV